MIRRSRITRDTSKTLKSLTIRRRGPKERGVFLVYQVGQDKPVIKVIAHNDRQARLTAARMGFGTFQGLRAVEIVDNLVQAVEYG